MNPLIYPGEVDWETQYLQDTLLREQELAELLIERLKQYREAVGKDETTPEQKQDIKKRIKSSSRRLKRTQRSMKAIGGNLAALMSRNQAMAHRAMEAQYLRQQEVFHSDTLFAVQSQMQQMSLVQPQAYLSSTKMGSAASLLSGQSDCYSPLYSPFYDSLTQPINYIAGRPLPPPIRTRYSVPAVQTEDGQAVLSGPLIEVGVHEQEISPTTIPIDMANERQRSQSLPVAAVSMDEEIARMSRWSWPDR